MSVPANLPANVKVVLVTGASSGIGQGIAWRLAARGWRVFGTSRHETNGFGGVDMLLMDADDDISVEVEDTPIADARADGDQLLRRAARLPRR